MWDGNIAIADDDAAYPAPQDVLEEESYCTEDVSGRGPDGLREDAYDR